MSDCGEKISDTTVRRYHPNLLEDWDDVDDLEILRGKIPLAEDDVPCAISKWERVVAALAAHYTALEIQERDGGSGTGMVVKHAHADGMTQILPLRDAIPGDVQNFLSTSYGVTYLGFIRRYRQGPRLIRGVGLNGS